MYVLRTRPEALEWFKDKVRKDPNPVSFNGSNTITIIVDSANFSAGTSLGAEGWVYLGKSYRDYIELGDAMAEAYASHMEGVWSYMSLFL